MTLSRILRAKMSVGSTRVRVASCDLCRRWSAEAPTEPAGETRALPRYLRITPPSAATSCGAQNSQLANRYAEFWPLRQQILPASATGGGRMCCLWKGHPELRLNFMVAKSVVLLFGKLTCRRPSLIAVRFGQPKTKPPFRNFKGKTAILCIIGKPT